MDNASNCNTTAAVLPQHIPTFGGMSDRLRCFTHCIQLIAHVCIYLEYGQLWYIEWHLQMIISFFNKQYRRKKASGSGTDAVVSIAEVEEDEEELQEVIEHDETEEEAAQRMTTDAGQSIHDGKVISSVWEIAIQQMAQAGIVINVSDAREALKIFPKA